METEKKPLEEDDLASSIYEVPKKTKTGKEKPLFEEEWSSIYPGELVINAFYFPTPLKKRIPTSSIRGIYYRLQDGIPSIGDTKMWGMSFSPCWWACDMKRKWRSNEADAAQKGTAYYDVVIDCGETTMKGFTTRNLREFRSILRQECHPDVVVKEGFPW